MASVGVRELRDHLSGLLRRVRDGETLIITDRGQPIGELRPVANRAIAERARTLVRQGLARWTGGKPKGLRQAPRPRKGLVSDTVIKDRE
jgi:prevent-host-death family protein